MKNKSRKICIHELYSCTACFILKATSAFNLLNKIKKYPMKSKSEAVHSLRKNKRNFHYLMIGLAVFDSIYLYCAASLFTIPHLLPRFKMNKRNLC